MTSKVGSRTERVNINPIIEVDNAGSYQAGYLEFTVQFDSHFNPVSAGTDFKRHNLRHYKDSPRTERIEIFIMAVHP